MQSNSSKFYSLHQSSFYQLSSKRRLLEILKIQKQDLQYLTKGQDLYKVRTMEVPQKKPRLIEEPVHQLKQVQRRIKALLCRIEIPEFLFSPATGRSYIDNAQQHLNSAVVRQLDIKNYFPSTSRNRVSWFFHECMKCSPDIAWILTNLSTFEGHLPTGSPLSPIMSYYAHFDMWNEIYLITCEGNCILTVYIDDLTISGDNVPGKLIWRIKQQIYKCGLRHNKKKEKRQTGKIRKITGVILCRGILKLPNSSHLKMHRIRQEIKQTTDDEQKKLLNQKLQGHIAQAHQIKLSNLKDI
jgi:Reverse transcriptase (RNA-dependent DNA polymerase)